MIRRDWLRPYGVIDTRARFVAPLVVCFGGERVTLVAGPLMTSRLVKFLRSQIGSLDGCILKQINDIILIHLHTFESIIIITACYL